MIRLFPQNEERLFLAFPLLFIPGVLYVAFSGNLSFWGEHSERVLHFICSVLFLNTVHVVFTFKMLLFFPEFNQFRQRNDARQRIGLWTELMVVVIFLIFFFLWGMNWLNASVWGPLGFVVYFFINFHHVFRQVEGLAVAYDQRLSLARPEIRLKLSKARSQEKWGYGILIFLVALSALSEVLLNPGQSVVASKIIFLVAAAVALLIYCQALRIHSLRESNKGLYLLRLFFFPLGIIDAGCAIVILAFHGVEYLFVYRKLCRQSTFIRTGSSRIFFWLTIPLVIVLLLPRPDAGISWILDESVRESYPMLKLMSAISASVAFLHFYLDRRLYDMKNVDVRETIGPLLTRAELP